MFVDETLDQYPPDVQPGRCLEGSPASFPPFVERSVFFPSVVVVDINSYKSL